MWHWRVYPKLVQITVPPLPDDLRLRRLLCGKAPPFRGVRTPTNPLPAAWKGSLPGGGEGEKMGKRGRKGGAFPHNGAAEPHCARQFSANWDGLGFTPPCGGVKPPLRIVAASR